MSKNHLRNIVLEAKTIKHQNSILARKLTRTVEERYSKITEHYDPEYLKNIINETVLNRTSDSVQELSRELLNNLRYGKVHETTNEGWDKKYKKFLKSRQFDFSSAPMYESYTKNTLAWKEYKQKMMQFVWESRDEVSMKQLMNELFNSVWRKKTKLTESLDASKMKNLLIQSFGESNLNLARPGNTVDIVEIVSSGDVIEISVDKNVTIAESRFNDAGVSFMDTTGKIYVSGPYMHRTIEMMILAEDGKADRGLQKIALASDFLPSEERVYDGWTIDFPNENFSTRFSKKFTEQTETLGEGWADFGRAAGNFLVGKETTAGIRKLAGMATGRATGSMSREDIIARDQYIKDFTSKVSAAIDSGVKSGVLVKAPAAAPNQAQAVAEATTRSQTISSYVVSTVEYYAQQAGVTSIDQFRPTIESLAQQIEQTYPRGAKQLVKKLANVIYSLTSSTMQQGARDENLTQKTDQVMDLINSMNKPDDIDDVAHIAKAALQKLYKGDQVMMSRMFNAVEVKAQERMGK